MSKFMIHANSNILCAVDIQTTGPVPGEHEIWHICILPLDSFLKPNKEIIPFYTMIRPENADPDLTNDKFITRQEFADARLRGLEQNIARDMVQEWFDNRLLLNPGKQIQPISYDWPWVYAHLIAWMGFHQTQIMFHPWYRDIVPYSLHANDSADLNIEQIPYPKSKQSFLERRLKVENSVRGEPMSDCLAIAAMWQASLKRLF